MRIKKVTQTTPVQAEVVDSLDGNSTTNAPSVRAVNEGLGNVRGQILWTNPNPTIAFEPQIINLSSDDYDFYEIIITPTINTVDNYIEVVKGIKGKGTYLKYFTSDGNVYRRKVDYVDGTKLTIENPTTSNGTLDNINIIPLYVIGYKTGLFS